MKFNVIFQSSRSLTLELVNSDIYNTQPYSVYINGELYSEGNTTNVLSIYDLLPSTEYNLEIRQNKEIFSKTISATLVFSSLMFL